MGFFWPVTCWFNVGPMKHGRYLGGRVLQRNLRTWGHQFIILGLLISLHLVLLARVNAQESAGTSVTPQSLLADQFMRLADKVMLSKGRPGTSQIVRAGLLADLAIQTNPMDADAWLMRKMLAQMAGDTQAAGDALVKYCQLRPSDDMAGFQLILAGLSQRKSPQEKEAALEQLLATATQGSMTKALQSRIASYLAVLYQSSGDQARFGKWLKAAVTLDPANREAARLMYELSVTRGGSDYVIGTMLLHMIKASPTDDMPRHLIADLLSGMGAYEEAQKQYLTASTLGVKNGGDHFLANWMVSMAASGRTNNMLQVIDSLGFKAGQADSSAVPVEALILKLAIFSQDNRSSEAIETFNAVRAKLQKRVDMGDVSAALELAWWTAVFGPNLSPSFEQAVTAYATANPDNALIQRTLGWVHYRKGRLEEAAKEFHVLAESDAWALYGLAKCSQGQNQELHIGYLQKTIRMTGTSAAAMMAARDLKTMGSSISIHPQTQQFVDAINKLPSSILMPLHSEQNVWTTLSIEVAVTQFGYLDPINAVIKLRNRSESSLTLGPGGTLPSKLALFLSPWKSGQPKGSVAPILLDLSKTLAIEPRTTLVVPVRLDRGQLGYALAMSPTAALGFSVTAVHDPRNSPKGGLTTGPLGSVAILKDVMRTALRPTSANIEAWIGQFKSPSDALSHMKLIASLCRMSSSLHKLPQMEAQSTQISTAVNEQFDNLGSLGQTWMALFVPTGSAGKGMYPKVHQGAANSNDVMLRIAYLAAHGKDFPDALATAAVHTDPRISAFAKAMQMP